MIPPSRLLTASDEGRRGGSKDKRCWCWSSESGFISYLTGHCIIRASGRTWSMASRATQAINQLKLILKDKLAARSMLSHMFSASFPSRRGYEVSIQHRSCAVPEGIILVSHCPFFLLLWYWGCFPIAPTFAASCTACTHFTIFHNVEFTCHHSEKIRTSCYCCPTIFTHISHPFLRLPCVIHSTVGFSERHMMHGYYSRLLLR